MGGSLYSGMRSTSDKDAYKSLYLTRKAATGTKVFTHTANIRSGKTAAKVHERVDPSKVVGSVTGKRESRDVDGKVSNAVAVLFDVTGSMGRAPVVLQEKLAKLMSSLLTKGVLDNPQILFGAVGDANSDRVPLQVGQFESDLAMDEDLDKFYLEGGGGGGNHESYELGLFFLSRLTSIDCHEKRGKRGYAFLIADEASYTTVKRDHLNKVFGESFGLQEDMSVEDIAREVNEKYELFVILPVKASGYGTMNKPFWNNLFPQHVLELDDVDLVCELIVSTIAEVEGSADLDTVAVALEMDSRSKNSVKNALSEYTGGRGSLATSVTGGDLSVSDDEDGIE